MLVICQTCSLSFEKTLSSIKRSPNNFCSRSCAATANNKGRCRNPKKPKKPKIRLSTDDYKKLTIGDYRNRPSVLGKHPSWLHSHIRNFARSWNMPLRQLSCQKCQYNTHVELAHIKAVSSFPDAALLGEINDSTNLLVLCRNHHWEFDNGVLLLNQIPSR